MKVAILSLALVSLLLGACPYVSDSGSSKAVKAAEIADEISATPDQMLVILSNHGYTAEQFQDLMLEIAGDPELTAEYEAARKFPTPE